MLKAERINEIVRLLARVESGACKLEEITNLLNQLRVDEAALYREAHEVLGQIRFIESLLSERE